MLTPLPTAAEYEALWNAEALAKAQQCNFDVTHLEFRLARYQFGSLSLNHEAEHNRCILRRALNIAIARAGEVEQLMAAE